MVFFDFINILMFCRISVSSSCSCLHVYGIISMPYWVCGVVSVLTSSHNIFHSG